MNQENKLLSNDLNYGKFSFMTFRHKLENSNEEQSSITPKRPLLSRDRTIGLLHDVSPLSDQNSRFVQSKTVYASTTPIEPPKHQQSSVSSVESCKFTVSPPGSIRSVNIDDEENTSIPVYIQRKARPAPSTTWKAPVPLPKSSATLKTSIESSSPIPELPPTPPIVSFQPAIRARIPFNLSSTNTIEKQAHAYTIWFNSLFTPLEFLPNTTVNQSVANEEMGTTKTFKSLAESHRWYLLRDRAREVFTREMQSVAAKISADTDIDQCRINPKTDMNFSTRTVNRQALLNFISSYNRVWFRLAMEVVFPVNIENYHQMKSAIDQYLIQSTANAASVLNETNLKKTNFNHNKKTASAQIRLTIKNLIIIVVFLERAKLLRLIDNDPCLYNRDSKFKSTKDSLDVLSRDFISTDTNLLRRLKLAGYEPNYRQTSLDEFNYSISNGENKLFEDLRDGIRLTRCAQILLSSTHEQVARFDLSTKLKCPVVNLVHKLLNIDQALELFQTYGHVDLTGISNKDIMNGNKQRTLELLWRVFTMCYLPKYLSPMEKLNREIEILSRNLSKLTSSVEQQLLVSDIVPLQKHHVDDSPVLHLLIKWVQLICAHYKFWLYDLQESFADGRAFLYIISYYLPSLCDYTRDIKHLTTLATCQTPEEHIQLNLELGQQQSTHVYERNVKSNFRLLEECFKQFGTFSHDLLKSDNCGKDVPDERCTIMILAMLAHDLIFSNTTDHQQNNDIAFRHQRIFAELNGMCSHDNESLIESMKEEIMEDQLFNRQEIDIIRENPINSSEISLSNEMPIEEFIAQKLSISSTTVIYSSNDTHPISILQAEPISILIEEETPDTSLAQSILDTMNRDILDRLEFLVEFHENDDDEEEEEEDSFNSARSSSTTRTDHYRTSIAATMATISFDDFVELEKTIENEENKTNNTSLSLIDVTISSEVDSTDSNRLDEVSFADPINTKMIRETFTLFLSHHQPTLTNKDSIAFHSPSNEQQSQVERDTHAAQIIQAHWRGHQVRLDNECHNHPVVSVLKRVRSRTSTLTIRERIMLIVQEYSEASASSLTAYLHFLQDIEPILGCCLEIRYLIAQQGLLRLFFILMKCCNRSGPSTVLLSKVLNILQLFTVKHDLTMKLITKPEQTKDFLMLLLKYYQNNGCQIFEQTCFLLQSIVNDEQARRVLRSNKSFTDAIEYIYRRIFNKISVEDEKYRQQVRSTPKEPTGSRKSRTNSLNQSSILHLTPKMMRPSLPNQHDNVLKQNLFSIEKFMKVFYRD